MGVSRVSELVKVVMRAASSVGMLLEGTYEEDCPEAHALRHWLEAVMATDGTVSTQPSQSEALEVEPLHIGAHAPLPEFAEANKCAIKHLLFIYFDAFFIDLGKNISNILIL